MNRRDALKRLVALGLVAAEPEIVRRFWPGWRAPTINEQLENGRAEFAAWLGVPNPGFPQKWDYCFTLDLHGKPEGAIWYDGERWLPMDHPFFA